MREEERGKGREFMIISGLYNGKLKGKERTGSERRIGRVGILMKMSRFIREMHVL